MASEKCITIIGGGFSGTLTAVQLLRQAPFPVCVKLINTGFPFGKGVAYSAESNLHLLNVRASRMSAFPHIPGHFVNWLEKQPDVAQFCMPGETLAEAFMPRRIFGQYVAHILETALDKMPAGCRLIVIEDEAVSIKPTKEKRYEVTLRNSPAFETEKVVLALGNFLPEKLKGLSDEVLQQGRYFGNPWHREAIENLEPGKPVLLVGTGLTMVDVVLSLLEQNFTGRIVAVSPKGFLPLVHRHTHPYPDFRKELEPPYNLDQLYGSVKKHIRRALAQGSSCEALIDSLRPQTQQIWQGLSRQDKKKFLRHLSSLWGVFRHRISAQIAERLQAALDSGQLQVMAGRLQAAEMEQYQLKVSLRERGQSTLTQLNVQRIINCTGPQTDYTRIASPLIQHLVAEKIIVPDELRLGLQALPDGRLVQENGQPSCALFTIGTALRGALWESTAVPEISEQAAHLAQTVLHAFKPEPETKTEINPTGAEK